jgi:hypothetical protein
LELQVVGRKKISVGLAGCVSLVFAASLFFEVRANETSILNNAVASCGERSTVISSLKEDYKEVQEAIGLSNGGGLIEIFVSPRGSFSITITNPSQITCIISAGEHWNKGKNFVASSAEM